MVSKIKPPVRPAAQRLGSTPRWHLTASTASVGASSQFHACGSLRRGRFLQLFGVGLLASVFTIVVEWQFTRAAFTFLALVGLYGVWKLLRGVIRLVRPQAEHESIPDIAE
jgi:hypothetical protein